MKVFALTGLVSVEKGELAAQLAEHFAGQGQTVTVLDNISRLPVEHPTNGVTVQRMEGDVLSQLPDLLLSMCSDVVVFAVSEQAHPDDVFTALAALHDHYDEVEVRTLALIDLRTCDCFPHVREQLELYADNVLMLPYKLDEVLSYVFDN